LNKNSKAHIIILDLGHLQIRQSKKVLSEKFPNAKISYVWADARNMPFTANSVDYIETDVLLNFMNTKEMAKVLKTWEHCLAEDGFITTRILASNNIFRRMYDPFLFTLGALVVGAKYKTHTLNSVAKSIHNATLKFVYGGKTNFFQIKRLSLVEHRNLSKIGYSD
jgi:ubiquinone/menaquinone biosynthesis C-methylase UbiE